MFDIFKMDILRSVTGGKCCVEALSCFNLSWDFFFNYWKKIIQRLKQSHDDPSVVIVGIYHDGTGLDLW